ncbi:ferredoxin [Novosphingobium sp. BL-8H]|uniref:ferredoxin n=1 Tax=Novosphingobium sp. BL-8H TaxID=3127640 RepID=UPI0037576BBD
MPKLNVIKRSGQQIEIDATFGLSVKDVLLEAGIDEVHGITNCGGCCSCGTCHVIFEGQAIATLPAIGECEEDLLNIVDGREAGSRLACQVSFGDALNHATVRIGPQS